MIAVVYFLFFGDSSFSCDVFYFSIFPFLTLSAPSGGLVVSEAEKLWIRLIVIQLRAQSLDFFGGKV